MTRRIAIDTGLPPLRLLLNRLIDYAGLFPPAGLGMAAAVEEFAHQRRGADSWALNRFVVPLSRLEEFSEAAADLLPAVAGDEPWILNVLPGASLESADSAISSFNQRHKGRAAIGGVETKADSVAQIEHALEYLGGIDLFFEIPHHCDPSELLRSLAKQGGQRAFAKIRTGGVTRESIASSTDVARFVAAAARWQAPFKATAGLHHPLRGEYPLTYDQGAQLGTMHGYLNLFLAAAMAAASLIDEQGIIELLEERSPGALKIDARSITWRDRVLTTQAVDKARQNFALSYGSCSFREPLKDLRALGSPIPASL